MAVSIVISNKAFFPGVVVSVTLSLGRQVLGSCQANLLLVRQNLFGAHISPHSHFLCFPKQRNKVSKLFFSFSGHEVIKKEIINLFLVQNLMVCKITLIHPLTERCRDTKPTTVESTSGDSQTLLGDHRRQAENRLRFGISSMSHNLILTNKRHHY